MWRPVPGYEGRYEVSSGGAIRSLISHKVLRMYKSKKGYCYVTLCSHDGATKTLIVHRLVALAFIGPPPLDKYSVLHRDGTPGNNAADNLYYGDATENARDALRHGRTRRGERHPACKLTQSIVDEVRKQCDIEPSNRKVGEAFGLSTQHVYQIRKGIIWRTAQEVLKA